MQVTGVKSMRRGSVRPTLRKEKIRLLPNTDSTMNYGDHVRATMIGKDGKDDVPIHSHLIGTSVDPF